MFNTPCSELQDCIPSSFMYASKTRDESLLTNPTNSVQYSDTKVTAECICVVCKNLILHFLR